MSVEMIAYNIKFFREQKGWTQEVLAKKIVTSRSNIAKWENSSATPDIHSLIKLSELYDVSLDHLVGIHSFQNELLLDFKRIYTSKNTEFDEDVVEIVEYIMKHPNFKNEIYRLKDLSLQKQLSIHELIGNLITQFNK